MTPEQLADAIQAVLGQAAEAGDLRLETVPAVRVERPRNRDHGDWSTNVALQLARPTGLSGREVAQVLTTRLAEVDGVAAVDAAGPGFVNITLEAASAGALAKTIVESGPEYGTNASMAGEVVNLEFVSANPTGPLHVGHTRWAALGDALGRLLAACGASVTAEHYSNDAGAQIDRLAESVLAAVRGAEPPEDGYAGDYVGELARQVVQECGDLATLPADQAHAIVRERSATAQAEHNRRTLEAFHVHFDVWFSERSLHDSGAVDAAVERLREQGHVFERDGATWLRTTDFGDDRDRVLIRATGEPTYFAADAAYYLSKKDRGFARKIYMLGADHHGYVGRLKAIAACAGDDPEEHIEVLIGQLIDIGGERMGRRRGNALLLDDLIEWIGTDPIRYSLARFPADSPLHLDGEDLRRRSNDNPVFYVQYAHARTRNVDRLARQDGVDPADGFEPSLLDHETEAALLAVLGDFPRVVAQAARLREPHRVARYLEDLAGRYHKWYDECRVRPQEAQEPITELHRTRLWLNNATAQVLRNGLDLLGVAAPERM
ncbi:MAG TPA: arginine--tRNA ligase [Ornithinimicrobium sp.]|uniref:arginine--tRNA ligase n=1 Tax=Ornithinimicrobium sp. TaxID=1977084 RepID=UPI002B464998|nr:arginine--tRNA ligase [Ornithinimicrobium sp.]HKJ12824.1 arginine--tRNA ligase [Ornithinimicrobium sp.]